MLNNSLKILTSLLFVFILFFAFQPKTFSMATPLPICPDFTDVPVGTTFYPYVRVLSCHGIIGGYDCGGINEPCDANFNQYFRPGNPLTRGQGAKLISASADFQDAAGSQVFEDIAPGSTFYEYINRLAHRSIISGYACGGAGEPCVAPGNRPYFRQNADLTRGQLSKLLSLAAGFNETVSSRSFEDIAPGSPFYDYIERLAKRNIIKGYPCGGANPCVPPNLPYFRPNDSVTRQQATQMVALTFFSPEVTPNPVTPAPSQLTPTPNATGTITGSPTNCLLKRTGDADCNGTVNSIDYLYYVAKVNGGMIPINVNPDFNGDGEVGTKDRDIIIKTLSGGGIGIKSGPSPADVQ